MFLFLISSGSCFQILFAITFWLLLRQHLTEQKALQLKEAVLSEVKVGDEENEEKGKLTYISINKTLMKDDRYKSPLIT